MLGSGWLVGQPPVTPAANVELFLLSEGERVRLFDVAADFRGDITASFVVPDVEPGTYRLESCGHPPGEQEGTCLQEGDFTILEGAAAGGGSAGAVLVIAILVAALVAGAGLLFFLLGRRRPAPS